MKDNRTTSNSEVLHIPVLLEETIRALYPQKGDRYLDLTAGYGGHAEEVIKLIGLYPVGAGTISYAETV